MFKFEMINILSISSRVAARHITGAALKNFMNEDFDSAVEGVQHLIDQLEKAKNTLNPQDEARETLEKAITDFNALRDEIRGQTKRIERVQI